jgi:hypothetical protein
MVSRFDPMRKRNLLFAAILAASAVLHSEPKEKKLFWTFRGMNMDLVQCDLVDNETRNCRFISRAPHPLDGLMEAIHRATKNVETHATTTSGGTVR